MATEKTIIRISAWEMSLRCLLISSQEVKAMAGFLREGL
jgi:hypothetical protein